MSGQYMINNHPTIHVHSLGSEDREFGRFGWRTVLNPHEGEYDWETDGLVAEPDHRCVAYVESSNDICAKAAIVVFAVMTAWPGHYGRFYLCGSHLARHRNGRPVRLTL